MKSRPLIGASMAIGRRQRRAVTALFAMALAMTSLAMTVGASATPEGADHKPQSSCPSGNRLHAATLPQGLPVLDCDLIGTIVEDEGIGAAIPTPGESVHASTFADETGVGQRLDVTTTPNGRLFLKHVGRESHTSYAFDGGTTVASTTAAGACSYDRLNLTPFGHESDPQVWYFSPSTRPAYLYASDVEWAISMAYDHWERSYNNCRVPDESGFRSFGRGSTTMKSNINNNATCGSRDLVNVSDFRRLEPTDTLAVACTWTILVEVVEADVAYDKSGHSWTMTPDSSSCTAAYDFESVATHEVGHSIGYNHVSEWSWPLATMSPVSEGPCQASERTLTNGEALENNREY